MSAFRHPHNHSVRSLDEELTEMGLNPDKVLSEIDRNTAMLEEGPVPLDLAGVKEGDTSPRSMMQYGETLLDEKKKCDGKGKQKRKRGESDDDDADEMRNGGSDGDDGYEGMGEGAQAADADADVGVDPDQARIEEQKAELRARLEEGDEDVTEEYIADLLHLIDEGWELDEISFGIKRKARGAAARVAKRERHRDYLKGRGAAKLGAKIFRRKNKRKIKKRETAKIRKWGRAGLAKLHNMGKRVVMKIAGAGKGKKEWTDRLDSIREELAIDTAPVQDDEAILDEDIEETFSPVVETLFSAAEAALYLGEIFDAMGDEAGQVLLDLVGKAVNIAEAVEANDGEPTEEQEKHIETVLEAVIKALAEHEERGSPSLGQAIGMKLVAEGVGEWDDLVEADWNPGSARTMKMKPGSAAGVDPSVAGKHLKALNMAMQKRDEKAAMKVADVVVKKHNVMDAKGLPVKSISTMTDVMRVMFYLSQATGLKAPSWMYQGKAKPWFVAPTSADDETPKQDKSMAAALKALGAPAGLLKALAA